MWFALGCAVLQSPVPDTSIVPWGLEPLEMLQLLSPVDCEMKASKKKISFSPLLLKIQGFFV